MTPIHHRYAYALIGSDPPRWCRNIGRGKRPFHFTAPKFQAIAREAHDGTQVSDLFRRDIVGPDEFERHRLSEAQRQVGQPAVQIVKKLRVRRIVQPTCTARVNDQGRHPSPARRRRAYGSSTP